VADTNNCTIRKITPAGVVGTLAGKPGSWIRMGGPGPPGRFHPPPGVCSGGAGKPYVWATNKNTLRKGFPSRSLGTVSTLAGLAGMFGSADGTGSTARFNHPLGVAVDGTGNLYVADKDNHAIRRVTPSGTLGAVTTIVGSATSRGVLLGLLPAS